MELSGLPDRTTPDREYLGAICDILLEQTAILEGLAVRVAAIEERITPDAGVSDDLVREEPETPAVPAPDPAGGPVEPEGVSQEIPLAEPLIPRPPTSGPGSGRSRWETYATSHGVTVDPLWNKNQIVEACRDAGI